MGNNASTQLQQQCNPEDDDEAKMIVEESVETVAEQVPEEDPLIRSNSIDKSIRDDAWVMRRTVNVLFIGLKGDSKSF